MSCSNASLQRAFEDDWHWVQSRQSFATCDMSQFIQNLTKKIVLEVVAVISVLPYPRTWTAWRPSVISTQTYWNPRCESVFIQPIPFQLNPLFTEYVLIFLPISAWFCLFVYYRVSVVSDNHWTTVQFRSRIIGILGVVRLTMDLHMLWQTNWFVLHQN